MKKLLIPLIIILFVLCKTEIESKLCDKIYPTNLSDTCEVWIYNPTTKYIISLPDEYYIWKKYGVIIGKNYGFENTITDSCYYEKSKEFYINKIGIDKLNFIDKKIDSLVSSSTAEYFHDSIFYHSFSRKNVFGEKAKLLDKKKLYRIKDSLSLSFKGNRDNFLEYWYVIDTLGNLKNVELINCNCSKNIENTIYESLKMLKWEAAIYQGKKVEFRDKDFIYIKGRK